MARDKSLIKISGTIGELSFYDSIFGRIVRQKGGPSAKQIAKSPSCAGIRRQNSEFGNASKAGKLLRQTLRLKKRGIDAHGLVWRVTKLMNEVKNCDTTSVSGKRHVKKGFASAAGKALAQNFDFNSNGVLQKVLVKEVAVNLSNQSLSINSLVPSRDLKCPKGATHAIIRGGLGRVDFGSGEGELKESADVLLNVKSKTSQNIFLQMPALSQSTGFDFYVLQIEFLQEVNSVKSNLNDKQYNCYTIIEVV